MQRRGPVQLMVIRPAASRARALGIFVRGSGGIAALIAIPIVLVVLSPCSDGTGDAPVAGAPPITSTIPRATPSPLSPAATVAAATLAPWPTATKPPPTATSVDPSPTSLSGPTARASELTDADRAYLARRMHPLFFTVQGLVGLSIQAELAAGDASVLSDGDWRSQTETYLAMLRESSQQLREPAPVPPDFQGLEQDLATLGKEAAAVAATYRDGVDRGDARELTRSRADLDQALVRVKQIEAELRELSARFGVTITASH